MTIKAQTPAQRLAAWEREDPEELRRAAAEWEALGYRHYPTYLRDCAEHHDGKRHEYPAPVQRPY